MSKKSNTERIQISKNIRAYDQKVARKTGKRYIEIDGVWVEKPLKFSTKRKWKKLR